MKTIRTIILIGLTLLAAWQVATWTVHAVDAWYSIQVIVVHTGESKTLQFNPDTHKEVRNEMVDGNVMLTIQPRE